MYRTVDGSKVCVEGHILIVGAFVFSKSIPLPALRCLDTNPKVVRGCRPSVLNSFFVLPEAETP